MFAGTNAAGQSHRPSRHVSACYPLDLALEAASVLLLQPVLWCPQPVLLLRFGSPCKGARGQDPGGSNVGQMHQEAGARLACGQCQPARHRGSTCHRPASCCSLRRSPRFRQGLFQHGCPGPGLFPSKTVPAVAAAWHRARVQHEPRALGGFMMLPPPPFRLSRAYGRSPGHSRIRVCFGCRKGLSSPRWLPPSPHC